jgi:hypothetical protein
VEGAVEAVEVAASLTKEVFNPLAKLTKGFQNVVLAKGQPKNDQVRLEIGINVLIFL